MAAKNCRNCGKTITDKEVDNQDGLCYSCHNKPRSKFYNYEPITQEELNKAKRKFALRLIQYKIDTLPPTASFYKQTLEKLIKESGIDNPDIREVIKAYFLKGKKSVEIPFLQWWLNDQTNAKILYIFENDIKYEENAIPVPRELLEKTLQNIFFENNDLVDHFLNILCPGDIADVEHLLEWISTTREWVKSHTKPENLSELVGKMSVHESEKGGESKGVEPFYVRFSRVWKGLLSKIKEAFQLNPRPDEQEISITDIKKLGVEVGIDQEWESDVGQVLQKIFSSFSPLSVGNIQKYLISLEESDDFKVRFEENNAKYREYMRTQLQEFEEMVDEFETTTLRLNEIAQTYKTAECNFKDVPVFYVIIYNIQSGTESQNFLEMLDAQGPLVTNIIKWLGVESFSLETPTIEGLEHIVGKIEKKKEDDILMVKKYEEQILYSLLSPLWDIDFLVNEQYEYSLPEKFSERQEVGKKYCEIFAPWRLNFPVAKLDEYPTPTMIGMQPHWEWVTLVDIRDNPVNDEKKGYPFIGPTKVLDRAVGRIIVLRNKFERKQMVLDNKKLRAVESLKKNADTVFDATRALDEQGKIDDVRKKKYNTISLQCRVAANELESRVVRTKGCLMELSKLMKVCNTPGTDKSTTKKYDGDKTRGDLHHTDENWKNIIIQGRKANKFLWELGDYWRERIFLQRYKKFPLNFEIQAEIEKSKTLRDSRLAEKIEEEAEKDRQKNAAIAAEKAAAAAAADDEMKKLLASLDDEKASAEIRKKKKKKKKKKKAKRMAEAKIAEEEDTAKEAEANRQAMQIATTSTKSESESESETYTNNPENRTRELRELLTNEQGDNIAEQRRKLAVEAKSQNIEIFIMDRIIKRGINFHEKYYDVCKTVIRRLRKYVTEYHFIIVGGAATKLHRPEYHTTDVDVKICLKEPSAKPLQWHKLVIKNQLDVHILPVLEEATKLTFIVSAVKEPGWNDPNHPIKVSVVPGDGPYIPILDFTFDHNMLLQRGEVSESSASSKSAVASNKCSLREKSVEIDDLLVLSRESLLEGLYANTHPSTLVLRLEKNEPNLFFEKIYSWLKQIELLQMERKKKKKKKKKKKSKKKRGGGRKKNKKKTKRKKNVKI